MIAAAANGYMSVGLSNVASSMSSGARGADGWVFSKGVSRDIWMRNEDQPSTDPLQSLTNVSITSNATHLFAEFDRLLNTADARDYLISTTDPVFVISAINTRQPMRVNQEIPKHSWWGNTQVNFGQKYKCGQSSVANSFLSGDGKFKVSWTLIGDRRINFTLEAQYTGWISMGLNVAVPQMRNSDCYTGWVIGSNVTLLDTWAPDSINQPSQDITRGGQSNVADIKGSQVNGKTTISFTRLLNTGDTNDVAITNQRLFMILAWSNTDGDTNKNYPKHLAYFVGAVNLLAANGSSSNSTNSGTNQTTVIGGVDPVGATFSAQNGEAEITWEIVEDSIIFKMKMKATGWISMGIADNPTMINADYYTGYVIGTKIFLFDTWSTSESQPGEDSSQGGKDDLNLIRGEEVNGYTTIVFSRLLDTGDVNNDVVVADKELYIQYAFHSTQDGLEIAYSIPQHNNYGASKINFFSGKSSSVLELKPGFVLSIVVLGCVVFYASFNLVQRGITYRNEKQVKKLKKSKSIDTQKNEDNPNVYEERCHVDPGQYALGGNASGHTMPSGRSYYRGAMKIEANVKDLSKLYGYDEAEPEKKPVPEVATPTNPNNKTSMISGVLNYRIPSTEYSIFSILFAFLYICLNILCLVVMKDNIPKGLGTIVAANAMFVTVPATRNSLSVFLFQVPFDRTIMYHRWMGRWVAVLAGAHFIGYLVNWKRSKVDIADKLAEKSMIFGIIGLISLVFIVITSLEPLRRKRFEVFFYSHFSFILFIVFGCLHDSAFIPYCIAAVVLYILDRAVRFFWGLLPMRTIKFHLKGNKNEIVQIVFKKHYFARLFKLYKPGQYVFLNFPSINFLEWHPFSVSSGPHELTMECHIKGLGDHTKKLIEVAKATSSVWVRVDGPYGNQKISHRKFPIVFLCAGGIGITPIMSILKDIYQYGTQDPKAKKHKSVIEKVYVCYTLQSIEMYEWFSEEWQAFYDKASKDGPELILNIYISRPAPNMDTSFFFAGRPKFPALFDSLVKDNPGKPCMVFVCGPKQIVKETWDLSMEKSRKGHNIHFHHETFEF